MIRAVTKEMRRGFPCRLNIMLFAALIGLLAVFAAMRIEAAGHVMKCQKATLPTMSTSTSMPAALRN